MAWTTSRFAESHTGEAASGPRILVPTELSMKGVACISAVSALLATLPAQTERFHRYSIQQTGVPYGALMDCNNSGAMLIAGTHVWRPGIGLTALPAVAYWTHLTDGGELIGSAGLQSWHYSLNTGVATPLVAPGGTPAVADWINDQGDIFLRTNGGRWLRSSSGILQAIPLPAGATNAVAVGLGCDGGAVADVLFLDWVAHQHVLYPSGPVLVPPPPVFSRFFPLKSTDCIGSWVGILQSANGGSVGAAKWTLPTTFEVYPTRFNSMSMKRHGVNSSGAFVGGAGGGDAWLTTRSMVASMERLIESTAFRVNSAEGLTDAGQVLAEGFFGASRECGEANSYCGIGLLDNADQIVWSQVGMTDAHGVWAPAIFVPNGLSGTFRLIGAAIDSQAGVLVSAVLPVYSF